MKIRRLVHYCCIVGAIWSGFVQAAWAEVDVEEALVETPAETRRERHLSLGQTEEQSLVITPTETQRERPLSLGQTEEPRTNDEEQMTNDEGLSFITDILQLSDRNQPATNLDEWMTQIAQSLIQITDVQVNSTETDWR